MTKVEKMAVRIADMFDEFLIERDVRIPSSEEEKQADNDAENDARIYGQDWGCLTDKLSNILDGFLAEFANAVINRIENMDTVACDEHAQAVFLMDVPKEVEETHSDFVWLEEDT